MAIHTATRKAARFVVVGGRVIRRSNCWNRSNSIMRSAMPSGTPDPKSTTTGAVPRSSTKDVESQPTRRRVRWTELYVEPLFVVLAAMSVALVFTVVLRPPATNKADFYVFWDSARWYRESVDPYLGHPLRPGAGYNLNAPAFIFLFLPFSYLPLGVAFVAWTIAGVLACWVAIRWIAEVLAIRSAFLLLCALLISQATFIALQLGQVTAFLLPLLHLGVDRRPHQPTMDSRRSAWHSYRRQAVSGSVWNLRASLPTLTTVGAWHRARRHRPVGSWTDGRWNLSLSVVALRATKRDVVRPSIQWFVARRRHAGAEPHHAGGHPVGRTSRMGIAYLAGNTCDRRRLRSLASAAHCESRSGLAAGWGLRLSALAPWLGLLCTASHWTADRALADGAGNHSRVDCSRLRMLLRSLPSPDAAPGPGGNAALRLGLYVGLSGMVHRWRLYRSTALLIDTRTTSSSDRGLGGIARFVC